MLAAASGFMQFTRANVFVRHARCTNQDIDLVRIPRSRFGVARTTTIGRSLKNEDAP